MSSPSKGLHLINQPTDERTRQVRRKAQQNMATATEDKMPSLGIELLERPAVGGVADQTPAPRENAARLSDGTGLFRAPGDPVLDMGSDGDDVGRSSRDQAICDMLDAAHGFLVRKIEASHKPRRVTCEVCEGPLPTPGADPDWLCQYYDETRPASVSCNCGWCLSYQDYLAGKYKPQGGRPRQRCGSRVCEREADKLRKRRKRAGLAIQDHLVPAAEPPVREALAAEEPRIASSPTPKQRDDNPPHVWNRPRRRNEPNWWLSCQVRRGLVLPGGSLSEKLPN